MQFERKTQTHTEREKKAEREIERGGINLRAGAGKPDRLGVTLNLSFRRKYGGIF